MSHPSRSGSSRPEDRALDRSEQVGVVLPGRAIVEIDILWVERHVDFDRILWSQDTIEAGSRLMSIVLKKESGIVVRFTYSELSWVERAAPMFKK